MPRKKNPISRRSPSRAPKRAPRNARRQRSKTPSNLGGIAIAARAAGELAAASGASEAIAKASQTLSRKAITGAEKTVRVLKTAPGYFSQAHADASEKINKFWSKKLGDTTIGEAGAATQMYSDSLNSLQGAYDAKNKYVSGDYRGAAVGAVTTLAGIPGMPILPAAILHAGLRHTGDETDRDAANFWLSSVNPQYGVANSLRSMPSALETHRQLQKTLYQLPSTARKIYGTTSPASTHLVE
jgi:hypothetical protein